MQIKFARVLIILCLLAGVVALTLGCDSGGIFAPAPTPRPLGVSTTARLGAREIIQVELAGNSTGHHAGQTSQFSYGLSNASGQSWQGEYCILLTDSQKVVMDAKHEVLNLASGEHIGGDLQITFPNNVPDGIYSLVFLVPSEGHHGIPLTVGNFTLFPFPSVYVPTACPK
jgi:hypothetical protein